MNYIDKLKDPRWQKKRLRVLERDNFTCKHCGDKKSTLHVHHTKYEKGQDPWNISDKFLITLCDICHEAEPETLYDTIGDMLKMIKQNGKTSFELSDFISSKAFQKFLNGNG